MYKSLLILFLLPIFMKYNDTSHKLLYKCLAHDVMRSAGQFSHSYLSYRCKCIVVPTVMIDDLDKSCAKAEPNFDKWNVKTSVV
jgi:hypothetical protein